MKENPTPKRRQAEKNKSTPLIISNVDKKAKKKEEKRRLDEIKKKRQQAFETGDEKYLPPRDQGPARKSTRDFIDSKRSVSEYFMPVALFIIVAFYITTGLIKNNSLAVGSVLFMYCFIFAMIVDAIVIGFQLKHYLVNKKNIKLIPRGTIWYGISRAFQFRKLRLPKPQVKRGELNE